MESCTFFKRHACIFGSRCTKQHGEDDERPVCAGCGVRKAPWKCRLCVPCHRASRREKASIGRRLCTHYARNECAYGDACIKQHGADDTRLICPACNLVRLKPGAHACSRCDIFAGTNFKDEHGNPI